MAAMMKPSSRRSFDSICQKLLERAESSSSFLISSLKSRRRRRGRGRQQRRIRKGGGGGGEDNKQAKVKKSVSFSEQLVDIQMIEPVDSEFHEDVYSSKRTCQKKSIAATRRSSSSSSSDYSGLRRILTKYDEKCELRRKEE